MDVASTGRKAVQRKRWRLRLPGGLPDLKGKWLTLYMVPCPSNVRNGVRIFHWGRRRPVVQRDHPPRRTSAKRPRIRAELMLYPYFLADN